VRRWRGGGDSGDGADDGDGGDATREVQIGKYNQMAGTALDSLTRTWQQVGNATLNDGYIQPRRSWRGGFTPCGVSSDVFVNRQES
jgi:hypothetical protein